jgi:hydroxymethylbilane synthase
VALQLRNLHPGLEVELRVISTRGDRVLDVALSKVGDKGLFVKEIEVALLQEEVDLAVHSGKDLPSALPAGLLLAAFPRRVDPRDALVLPLRSDTPALAAEPTVGFDTLPAGARVGTSSLRRASQLRALRPDLNILDVRGNVGTRLRKLDEGHFDALILASAGLLRLGLGERISAYLPPEVMLPAVAQGALAIEARADDHTTLELLAALDDRETRIAVLAERACLRRLEGGCQVPIAAHTEIQPNSQHFRLRGMVAALDGSSVVRDELVGDVNDPESAGIQLAESLLAAGAANLLAEQRTATEPDGTTFSPPPTLHGWRVVVTRSRQQSESINECLRAAGAEPVDYPTIAFAPPGDSAPLHAALHALINGGYDWLVLTSVIGVQTVHDQLEQISAAFQATHTLPIKLKVATVGAATAEACIMLLGVRPAVVPDKYVAEELAAAIGNIQRQHVLLPQADLARPVLRETLEQAGAHVDAVVAYRTMPVSDDDGPDLAAMLAAGEIHAITFTSGSTVRNFVERLGSSALEYARNTIIACIGPVTAEAAREAGLEPTIVAETSTVEGLVDALAAWRQQQQ